MSSFVSKHRDQQQGYQNGNVSVWLQQITQGNGIWAAKNNCWHAGWTLMSESNYKPVSIYWMINSKILLL